MLGNLILRNSSTLRNSRNLFLTSLRSNGSRQVQRKYLHGSRDIQSLIQKPQKIRITLRHRSFAGAAIAGASGIIYFTWMYDNEINEAINPVMCLIVPAIGICPFIITFGLRVIFGTFIAGAYVI